MPRKAREISSTNIYHVVVRGADRQRIFENPSDYKKYINLLEYYKEDLKYKIYAYCLMSNHIHLLIYTKETSLESVFRHINTSYAVWFNMKYTRTGFLQQGRYYSEPVESQRYFLNAIRYIHQNPCKAGLEDYPGQSYLWSSFKAYEHYDNSFVDVNYAIDLMGSADAFITYQYEANDDSFLDLNNIIVRLPDDVAMEIISTETNCSCVADFQKLSMIDRDRFIVLLIDKGISIRQLNRLTGVPKGIIERILLKNQSK